ncbi:MAG TPA: YciI family protein [Saprospiraceae bacterium]|nr:YciI family protein [Saprospiraceae bacterium]
MKAILFYETAPVTMDAIMAVYPRHKALVDQFATQGRIIAIGTYANPAEGSMAIFKDKQSADDFTRQDPFVLEGIVAKFTIKEWNETLLG